jgi:REP element-mobilizing transposase RayT
MILDPSKGYRALRHGRFSKSGDEYFITFCTEQRQSGLTTEPIAGVIVTEIKQMETEAIWSLRCAVLMPDHIHLLIQLGNVLPLGKSIARLKSKSSIHLKTQKLRWQKGYYEHTMRTQEDRLPVFLYMYLNPYKANLLPVDCIWPWFICSAGDKAWFSDYLDKGLPEPTWMADLP